MYEEYNKFFFSCYIDSNKIINLFKFLDYLKNLCLFKNRENF